jgi:hypothetical protein
VIAAHRAAPATGRRNLSRRLFHVARQIPGRGARGAAGDRAPMSFTDVDVVEDRDLVGT